MKFTSKTLIAALATVFMASPAFAASNMNSTGVHDNDGVLRFPYGQAKAPVIACSTLNVCEIILQKGEKIYDMVAGDQTRWVIQRGVAGETGDVPAIFFKPTDTCDRDGNTGRCNGVLRTNIIITTNKHNYEMVLVSDSSDVQTRYGFVYAHDTASTNTSNGSLGMTTSQEEVAEAASVDEERAERATPAVIPPDADCSNYRIVGQEKYTPTKVCNDGTRTYVQIPKSANSPTFQTQAANGDFSLPTVHPQVDGLYILDGMPDHVVIIGDVGRKAPHVDVFHNGAK